MTTTPVAVKFPVPDLRRLPEVTSQLAATAETYDRTAAFPTAGIQAAYDAGLLTATVGSQYGGPGLGISDTARIFAALGEGDPSTALIVAMTLNVHNMQGRRPHWPDRLYSEVLARSAEGPALLNHARVEPDLGSPARGGLPATTARRTANGWAVSGAKRFVTGSEGLAWYLVWATTDEPEPRVGTFAVPGDAPGIEITRRWDHLGLRASGSHDIAFHDVEIPADSIINVAAQGPAAEQDNRAGALLHLPLAALYLGVARAAQQYFHRFAHERVPANLGHPVARTERFRQAAGEIQLLLDSADQLIHGGAQRADLGDPTYAPEQALAAKILATRHATTAVQTALRLLGNPGLTRDNPLERHFRDIQCAPVHAPQEDTALLVIGTSALRAWAQAQEPA
jgi:alkylation response protein AidB-like acyl-CoA dehydrogenase